MILKNIFDEKCVSDTENRTEVVIEERKDLTSFSYNTFLNPHINEQSRRPNMAGAVANVVHQLLVPGHRLSTRISDDVAVPENSN